jgi:hypothetical protein
MSFLSDLGLDKVDGSALDYSIPNGVYPAMISDSKIIQSKTGDDLWQITYQIDPEVETFGKRTVSEFFNLDPNLPTERKAWLKRRLTTLGISDEQAATMEPSDIIGVDVTLTVKNRNVNGTNYTNVAKVVLGNDAESYATGSGFYNNF